MSAYRPERVLVTGGTGFVGSHTVAALCAGGHHVKLLVRDPARMAPALAPHGLADLDYEVGDVTDAAAVERLHDAGATMLGKLNMTEWATPLTLEFSYGQPVNPWNIEHDAGLLPRHEAGAHDRAGPLRIAQGKLVLALAPGLPGRQQTAKTHHKTDTGSLYHLSCPPNNMGQAARGCHPLKPTYLPDGSAGNLHAPIRLPQNQC